MFGLPDLPRPRLAPACESGEFAFGVIGLEHGHIHAMCAGLLAAGAELRAVYDPDPGKIAEFRRLYPSAQPAEDRTALLNDPAIQLVVAAPIPCQRADLAREAMEAGKDFYTAKPPFLTLREAELTRAAVRRTGRKLFVHFSERLLSESALYAGELIAAGVIGRVVQVIGFGPHRLNAAARPPWFFDPVRAGGILGDLGSHQMEQVLQFTGAQRAEITSARMMNAAHPEHPNWHDFGECSFQTDTGASAYLRVDWLTPSGLGTWGDGRTFILGTAGTIELRKFTDVARESTTDHLYLVTGTAEHHLTLAGKVGIRFFGDLIRDCRDRTETALPQEQMFLAVELCLRAQIRAGWLEPSGG